MRRLARLLLVTGTVTVVLGLCKAHAAAHGYDFTQSFRFAWSLAYIALLIVAAYGAGLPELPRTARSAVLVAVGSNAAAAVGFSVLQLLVGSAVLPRYVVLGTPAILVPFMLFCAALARAGTTRDGNRDRVVAVAGLAEGVDLAAELEDRPERPAVLATVLSSLEASSDKPGVRPLVEAVRTTGATAVVLDRAAQSDDRIVAQAAWLHEAGVRVRTLSLFYEQWLGKMSLSELERVSLLFDINEVHGSLYGRMKRLMDIVVGLVGLFGLTVILPLVWLGNRIGNQGPLFYSQPRVGKGGREFRIHKFRTMRPGDGPTDWTTDDDRRVTPFGRWLRRSHLDELPQMLNILLGDLSVVGPRPEQPQYVEELTEKLPFYSLRHLVRPGLTGWAQVKYPYGANEIDALEKLQYEFYYLRHQGVALDLRIVGRTIRTVVGRGGR